MGLACLWFMFARLLGQVGFLMFFWSFLCRSKGALGCGFNIIYMGLRKQGGAKLLCIEMYRVRIYILWVKWAVSDGLKLSTMRLSVRRSLEFP